MKLPENRNMEIFFWAILIQGVVALTEEEASHRMTAMTHSKDTFNRMILMPQRMKNSSFKELAMLQSRDAVNRMTVMSPGEENSPKKGISMSHDKQRANDRMISRPQRVRNTPEENISMPQTEEDAPDGVIESRQRKRDFSPLEGSAMGSGAFPFLKERPVTKDVVVDIHYNSSSVKEEQDTARRINSVDGKQNISDRNNVNENQDTFNKNNSVSEKRDPFYRSISVGKKQDPFSKNGLLSKEHDAKSRINSMSKKQVTDIKHLLNEQLETVDTNISVTEKQTTTRKNLLNEQKDTYDRNKSVSEKEKDTKSRYKQKDTSDRNKSVREKEKDSTNRYKQKDTSDRNKSVSEKQKDIKNRYISTPHKDTSANDSAGSSAGGETNSRSDPGDSVGGKQAIFGRWTPVVNETGDPLDEEFPVGEKQYNTILPGKEQEKVPESGDDDLQMKRKDGSSSGTPNNEELSTSGRTSFRVNRLLGPLVFGGPNYAKTDIKKVKKRIADILERISEFEKIRAKASSIKRLQKIIKSLKNVCPPNTSSLRVGHKCYEHVTGLWMDYDSAIIYCTGRGGTLALPNLENDNYLKELREYFPSLGDNSVLVGISDLLQEGHFLFTDGSPVSPHRFYEGKFPIYAEKDCVSLTAYKGFGLVDTDCKRLHEVLCEYEPVNLLPYY